MSTNQKRQPKGTKDGGQFAPDVHAESTVKLGESPPDSDINRETGTFTLGDHAYQFEKTGPQNDVTNYVLTNDEGGGGWRFEYDSLTRRATAHGARPTNPSAEWRDKGEADIRSVVHLFEPDAKLLNLDGTIYLIGGESWLLSESHLSGISTGEMMLIGGKSEDDLREYAAQERISLAKSEAERPDSAASFAETRRYIEGIELAADTGRAAAKAGTVGAMRERFADAGVKMVKCSECQAKIHPLAVFPKGRCVECHAAVTPMPTAQEVRRAWGIR